jgi:hypothetical protein
MKLTKSRLRQIVAEELQKHTNETRDVLYEELLEAANMVPLSEQPVTTIQKRAQAATKTGAAKALSAALKSKGGTQKIDEIFNIFRDFVNDIAKNEQERRVLYRYLIAKSRAKFTEFSKEAIAAEEPGGVPGQAAAPSGFKQAAQAGTLGEKLIKRK